MAVEFELGSDLSTVRIWYSFSGSIASQKDWDMFDFLLSPRQQDLRLAAQVFRDTQILPIADRQDRIGDFPVEISDRFYRDGWMDYFMPEPDNEEPGTFLVDSACVVEELAYGCAGIGASLMLPILVNRTTLSYLDKESSDDFRLELQKEPFMTAFAASEHTAGSDLKQMEASARKTDGGWLINGSKAFSSNLRHARYVVVVARELTDGKHAGNAFPWFLVPTSAPGVKIGPAWETFGIRAMDVSPLYLNDVEIPEERRLGGAGHGLSMMAKQLSVSRTWFAAVAVGIARRARDVILEYARGRKLYGGHLYKLQDYRFQLVEMEQGIAAARSLVWLSALKHDAGLDHRKEASIAKLFAGQMVMQVTAAASMMMGGMGYTSEIVLGKLLRDARHVAILEGPEPVQKELVFHRMLRRDLY